MYKNNGPELKREPTQQHRWAKALGLSNANDKSCRKICLSKAPLLQATNTWPTKDNYNNVDSQHV